MGLPPPVLLLLWEESLLLQCLDPLFCFAFRGLHRFPSLVRLDLCRNRITTMGQLRPLSAWSGLRALTLLGNPVAQVSGFHLQLANLLPQLEGCDVSFTIRKERHYVRCPLPKLFSTEKFNAEIVRLKSTFSYTGFLSALTGGLGCSRLETELAMLGKSTASTRSLQCPCAPHTSSMQRRVTARSVSSRPSTELAASCRQRAHGA